MLENEVSLDMSYFWYSDNGFRQLSISSTLFLYLGHLHGHLQCPLVLSQHHCHWALYPWDHNIPTYQKTPRQKHKQPRNPFFTCISFMPIDKHNFMFGALLTIKLHQLPGFQRSWLLQYQASQLRLINLLKQEHQNNGTIFKFLKLKQQARAILGP